MAGKMLAKRSTMEKVECTYCEGQGEIADGHTMLFGAPEPKMVTCPECMGEGEISEDQADHVDTSRSMADYEQDEKESYWESQREYDDER